MLRAKRTKQNKKPAKREQKTQKDTEASAARSPAGRRAHALLALFASVHPSVMLLSFLHSSSSW